MNGSAILIGVLIVAILLFAARCDIDHATRKESESQAQAQVQTPDGPVSRASPLPPDRKPGVSGVSGRSGMSGARGDG